MISDFLPLALLSDLYVFGLAHPSSSVVHSNDMQGCMYKYLS